MVNNAKFVEGFNGASYFGERGAAGSIVLSQKTGRLMLGRRSEDVLEPGTWGTWGGAIEEGSNPARAAVDELFEESGFEGKMRLEPLSVFRSPDGKFAYHNFVTVVDDEYTPWANHETDGHQWFELGEWPDPLHYGMESLLADPDAMNKLTGLVQRAKAGEDLLADAKRPERTLYHCMYKEPEGDVLGATCEREVNGRTEKFLFATPYLSKALAFSFSYHSNDGEIIANGSLDGVPEEFAVICDRDKTLNKERSIRVLSFSSEGFEQAWDVNSRQYVSAKPVPFDQTKTVFTATTLPEIMREGLQIFSTDKTLDELLEDDIFAKGKAKSNVEWLHFLKTREGFIWENDAQGVGKSAHLQEAFDKLSAASGRRPQQNPSNLSISKDLSKDLKAKLYHSTPYPKNGDVLTPATRNVSIRDTGQGKIAEQIEYADENTPYVYAADNQGLSITYAVTKGVRLGNMTSPAGAEILFVDQESIIGDPELKGGIYAFESGNFFQIHQRGQPTSQWVSAEAVDLRQAEYTPVRSLNDIMKNGVQIYQIADDSGYDAAKLYQDMTEVKDDASLAALIGDLAQAGKLRWMNQERGINPVNCLSGAAPKSTPDANAALSAPKTHF